MTSQWAFLQNAKNTLVWIVPGTVLQNAVGQNANSIIDLGLLRVIVGHSPDVRRIFVEPPLELLPINSRHSVYHRTSGAVSDYIVAFLADVHAYVHLYEVLRSGYTKCRKAFTRSMPPATAASVVESTSSKENMPYHAFRTWMGYEKMKRKLNLR